MKKVFIIAAILAMSMPTALAADTELIADGGFEGELLGEGNWKFTEYGGWYTEGVAERTDDAKSGSSAVKMNAGIMYQRVAMEKGVTYELSMYLKAEKECDIDICFNDGAEEWPAINGVSVQSVTVGTDWREVRLEFQSPLTQDYVLSFGTWDEIDVFADDVSIKESGSYISQLKTGVDADGAISYQAEYKTDGVFIAALYDEGGSLLGCIKGSDKGTFSPVQGYGKYTVKGYLLGGGAPQRIGEQETVYSEESAADEDHAIGPVRSVALSENSIEMSVGGAAYELDAQIKPLYAFDKNVVWTSSDESVAAVSQNGIVTPVGEGTAVITAANGEIKDECTVNVTPYTAAESISLNATEITLPELDSVYSLTAEVLPENASDKSVIWESSNTEVAAVNGGAVTAVGEGTAVITAKTADGKSSAQCSVTVNSSDNTITNDRFYKDTDGNNIYSQGGGIFKFGDKYYWYGIKYAEGPVYAANPENGAAGNAAFEAFTCYSSTDLVNWEFEGYPMTRETEGMKEAGWVGRMGVAYNENTKKYVLISQYAPGIMFATSDTPEGPYKFEHIISDVDYIVNGTTGDQTVFIDDDGKAYIICSSTSGREYLYVAPLRESDYLDIDADKVVEVYHDEEGKYIDVNGDIAVKDKKGIEGNCMFKYNGNYYFTGSDLYGWNSSRVYVLQSDNILGSYTPEVPYLMPGTAEGYAHNSQAGFYVTVKGSENELVIYCGDRWCDFAGNGLGYNQWVPLTMDEDGKPHFNDLHQWRLDINKGTWEVGEGNNYISNPEFEADRVEVESPAGWEVRDSLDGDACANVKGKREAGNFVWQQGNEQDYVSELYQDIDGLPDGTYTLKAWVRTSGGQDVCRLYAQSGGNEYSVSLKNMSEDWTETVVSSQIEVKDGKCRIGLYSDAPGGTWVQIDELELVRNVE